MTVTFLTGDSRMMLETLDDKSVQCCVTSPPYYGLRDYGVDGQIGLEPTLEAYVAEMVALFRGVRRVLRDDGAVWLNLGDSYANIGHAKGNKGSGKGRAGHRETEGGYEKGQESGFKNKDLLMVPARVAIALQADGWYLRSDIIWAKPNPMPESTTDRPTSAHEHVFLLTKSAKYFYDAEGVKEQAVTPAGTKGGKGSAARFAAEGVNSRPPEYAVYDGTRNRRNVWTIPSRPFRGAHFATMPVDLADVCVRAGTSERGCCPSCGASWVRVTERPKPPAVAPSDLDRFGTGDAGVHRKVGGQYQKWLDENPTRTTGWKPTCSCPGHEPVSSVVLDPFGGAGTTALAADRLGRDAILLELNPEYVILARDRIDTDRASRGLKISEPEPSMEDMLS